jgi:Flp pilus assembly protein TadG
MQRLRFLQAEFMRRSNKLRRDKSGVAAIEFAMIVPIMVMLFFGTVEFSQALTVDRRVAQIASTMADLVAQYDTLTYTQVDNIHTVAKSLVMPYPESPLKVGVWNLERTGAAVPAVPYGKAYGGMTNRLGSAYTETVPPGLLDVQDPGVKVCVVMAEVEYAFTPTIGQWLTNGVTLREKFYLKPRKSTCVEMTVG